MGYLGVATKRTHIVIPDELLAELDVLVGPGSRSSFLTEVIREAVSRRRLLEMLGSKEPVLNTDNYPEFRDGSEGWIRSLRDEDQDLDGQRIGGWLEIPDAR